MSYPEEIIAAITARYKLSGHDVAELRNTLALPCMREIIENGFLPTEDLVKQIDACVVVLPSDSARRVIAVYDKIRDLDAFRNGTIKLSQLMKWLTVGKETYVYVPFSDLAEQKISQLEYEECCAKLKKITVSSFTLMRTWDIVKDEVERLKSLPASKLRECRSLARKIRDRLDELHSFVGSNGLFIEEQFVMTAITSIYTGNDRKIVEQAAREYFARLFTEQGKIIDKDDMKFFGKTDGVQLGGKIRIKYVDSQGKQEVRYFVKTHQYGSTSEYSSRMPVDPKELLVYKTLEHMGFTPKTHFFVDTLSIGACFIATQDVVFTRTPLTKRKEFTLFKYLDESLSKLLAERTPIDDETRRGVARTDILARIFRLHDVATNPNNFGRVIINDTRSKWQIVDFRTDTMSVYGFPEYIFGGFRDGNGMFQYKGSLYNLLKESPEKQRMEIARQVLTEFELGRTKSRHTTERKMPLPDAVNKAFCETVEFLKHNATYLNVDVEGVLGKINWDTDILSQLETLGFMNLGDLGRYVRGVQENFSALNEAVKKRCVVLANETSITPDENVSPANKM